jgi:hydrogenase maturation protease
MLGHRPQAFSLVGVQPVELADYGGSLTPAVRDQVPRAIEIGLAELAAWGVVPAPRQHPQGTAVVSDAIAQGRYETERPPEDVAWRKGDERFMALRAASDRTDDDGESR